MSVSIAVGIMTHNVIAGLRHDLLVATMESAACAFLGSRITVFDNNSTDGTRELVRAYGGVANCGGNGTPGAGRNHMLRALWMQSTDILVLSDDDMQWHADAGERLVAFFGSHDCPLRVALVSGLLEPEYPWNTPRETVSAGGMAVLIRDSCPGCAWAIPRRHLWGDRWSAMQHLRLFKDDFGYDHDYCIRLAEDGLVVGQLDLATHLGWEASTHGNRADRDIRAKPLDRSRWGI